MKNQKILKDELILLSTDRSAVLTELRKSSEELKSVQGDIGEAEQELAGVRNDIKIETARLDDMRGRAVLVSTELNKLNVDIQDARVTAENLKAKNGQESKLHLGRIKELQQKIDKLEAKAEELRKTYDLNADIITAKISELNRKYRELDKLITAKKKEFEILSKDFERKIEEDNKATKDRLKREDKLRVRERMVDMREVGLDKKEEDLTTLGNDMMIIYGRLKELYAEVKPEVDLDKLIIQP